ncbi:ComE operon protein 2 [Pullulanibacillus sp. KACC 23026]|uniref:ComE operon protein 2 n=1 Tax=Pullulanibacillus sp. KACC 23026 TaxID=3028315 RepID=UPI0023B03727|nr:ComE operon protein 2 [Pullulanibacillus sp. KACC 23026]WEG14917.1 ComE operon protein 2 [Pullulanibacillus sp. KACC 23026]
MAQSHLLANRSTCARLAVGATIVRDNRIIAGGYNGSIAGGVHCIDEGCYVVDGHCIRTIHAEMNALLQCAKFGVPTQNAEIYVTHFPCLQCCKAIIQAGIKKVYYASDYKNHPYAIELFNSAEVETIKVPYDSIFEESIDDKQTHFIADLLKRLEKKGTSHEEMKSLYENAQALFSRGN